MTSIAARHTSDVTGSMAEGAPRPGENCAAKADKNEADKNVCPTPGLPPRINPAWLIVPCLACDFLMVPVFSSINDGPFVTLLVALALGIIGCILAQGCLLAAWLAWSDGPFLRRLARHWLIFAGLYLIWLVGLVLAFVPDPAAPLMAAIVALGVPLVSVAAQFPLWLARLFWGWRLVQDAVNPLPVGEGGSRSEPGEGHEIDSTAETAPDRKLAIRDLMLATLVVAVSLALARLAPSPDAGEMWPVWAFSCTIACVISSITLLPAGAWLLRPSLSLWERVAEGRVRVRRGLFWSILYASAWIALVWIIVAAQWWFALPRAPRAIYVGISSVIFTFASTVILTALIARSHGYHLTARRKRP